MTQAQDYIVQGGYELARRLLIKAFGEAEAEGIMQRLTKARELNPLESLQRADPAKAGKISGSRTSADHRTHPRPTRRSPGFGPADEPSQRHSC